MPRLYPRPSENSNPGSLVIEATCFGCFDVFYIPSKELLGQLRLEPDSAAEHRIKLQQIDCGLKSLTIFPTKTRANAADFLKPEYQQIERITIVDWEEPVMQSPYEDVDDGQPLSFTQGDGIALLDRLSSCFIKDYDYGLGLTQRYRFVVNTVEDLSNCTEIVISPHDETRVDGQNKIFYISLYDFEKIRKSIDTTVNHSQTAARSVNYASIRNILAERIGQNPVLVKTGRNPLRKLITEAAIRGEDSLSDGARSLSCRAWGFRWGGTRPKRRN